MREADNAADLATPAEDLPEEALHPEQATAAQQGTPPDGNSGRTQAVYELAALVAHILEDTGAKEKSSKGKKERNEDEGHIVAHIKVISWTMDIEMLGSMRKFGVRVGRCETKVWSHVDWLLF